MERANATPKAGLLRAEGARFIEGINNFGVEE
jgi:hypothetical protein